MIEEDERRWKTSIEAREGSDRARALRRHAGSVLLAIFITPAVLEACFLLAMLFERAPARIAASLDLSAVFFMYFAMLFWGFPAILPVAVSHVACTALLRRRRRLNFVTAAACGAVHGLLALLLFAAVYASDHVQNWMEVESLATFGAAGFLVGLALHAADRRGPAPVTAP